MSVSPVAYEDFQTANQAFIANGGPWRVSFANPADYAQCPLTKETWCDPGGYCLQCSVFPPDAASRYEITYTANISVNMAQYGSSNSVAFSWEFWPLYIGSNITAGSQFPISSSVNGVSFQDTQIAQDFQQFFSANGGRSWGSTPKVSHTGTTTVTRGGSDGAHAYIPLTIKYSFTPGGHTEYFNHYTKAVAFSITTPIQTVIPPASSTPGPTTIMTPAASSGSLTAGTRPSDPSLPSASSDNSLSPAISSSSPDSPSSVSQAKLTSAAVAGTVLGSVAFIFLVLALVFYHRRRSKRFASIPLNAYNPVPPSAALAAFPLEKRPRTSLATSARTEPTFSPPFSIPLQTPSPYVTHSTYSGVQGPGRGSTVITMDEPSVREPPPPMYDLSAPYAPPNPRPIASASPALVAFANAHRDLIGEDLEARLADAGYLPTDDPDNLSEEEWRTLHNVTKLELVRLRALYNTNSSALR